MLTILSVTLPIFILIGVGYAGVRFGLLSKADSQVVGRFVLYFGFPALIYNALSRRQIGEIFDTPFLLAYLFGSLAVFAFGLFLALGPLRRRLPTAAVVPLGMALPNSGFVAYSILLQMFPDEAGVFLALALLVENVIMIPFFTAIAESTGGKDARFVAIFGNALRGLVRSPMIWGIVFGLAGSLLQLQLPVPVQRSVDMLAGAAGAGALIAIGGALFGLKLTGLGPTLLAIAAGKLLVHPALVFLFTLVFPPTNPHNFAAAMIIAASPMFSIYPIFGQRYGAGELSAAALLLTTILSFFTLTATIALVGPL